jgi:hypothetical protein
MITTQTNSENPENHWPYIEGEGRVALDLGCGRWQHHPDWYTTSEWLIHKGASRVYGYDISQSEVDLINANPANIDKITAYCRSISTVDDIREILNLHQPKLIKCDIEGYESVFLDLTDDEFTSVDFYALETHSDQLYEQFFNRFTQLGYEIIASIQLLHAPPMRVLFAKK